MSIGLLFWILMLGWLGFSLWSCWPPTDVKKDGGSLLLFLLLLLLGWHVFGPAIHQ